MRTWLRSAVNAVLGKVPGKTGRLDTATRMAMDADFGDRREPRRSASPREREHGHLIKPIESSADIDELIRIVNKAQKRDAQDERRLYDPKPLAGLRFRGRDSRQAR
jgi:hypothetical protein